MKGTPTEIEGLTLISETHYDGDYSAQYRHYKFSFACNVVAGEIRIHGLNGENVRTTSWQYKSSLKAVTAYFAKKIASFPKTWHTAHAAIYDENAA